MGHPTFSHSAGAYDYSGENLLYSANASAKKIVALEEKWLACDFGQGVSETIAKVQPGGVTAAAAKIAVSFARDSRLLSRHGLDADRRFAEQIVEFRGQTG